MHYYNNSNNIYRRICICLIELNIQYNYYKSLIALNVIGEQIKNCINLTFICLFQARYVLTMTCEDFLI